MKELVLSCGLVTLVDDTDYDKAMQGRRWHAKPRAHTIYAHRGVRGVAGGWTTQTLHSFIMGMPFVDHVNGDGLDNRRANLRPATKGQNAANARLRADSASGFKGVGWNKARGRWRARIMCDGKSNCLGYFLTAEEAALSYDEAARELFGEFARTNFPEGI